MSPNRYHQAVLKESSRKAECDVMSSLRDDNSSRKRWMAVLARAPRTRLEEVYDALAGKLDYRVLRPAEVGLVLVCGRVGGNGRAFNVGEMTLTRASVELPDGTIGHGYMAGRDKRKAELIAVFDALLQRDGSDVALLRDLVDKEESRQSGRSQNRMAKVAATRVDFFTMTRGEE